MIVLVSSFLLLGCGEQSIPERLMGAWKIYDVDFIGEGISNEVKAGTRHVAHSVKYSFESDFTYTISSGLDEAGNGTWKYREETDEIILTPQLEEPFAAKVFFSDENALALHFEKSKTVVIYHLKRIN